MSTHIINFPGADIHTTTLTSVSNVSVGENLDVTSNLMVSGDTTVSGNVEMSSNLMVSGDTTVSGNVEMSSNLTVSGDTTVSGNVGVGTTEPTESLDIVGNLNLQKVSNTASIKLNSNVVTEYTRSKKLIKYPRVAMTAATTSGYTVSASSADTNNSRTLYGAFDGIFDNAAGEGWQSLTRYSTTTGLPDSSADNATFTVAGIDYTGQWVKLELPESERVRVKSIVIASNRGGGTDDRRPHEGVFLGSNDDTNWELIKAFHLNILGYVDFASGNDTRATVDDITNTSYYKYLMIVVTKIATTNQYGVMQINELEYYGIPEYDPDADGTDVIMRSVPNVPNTDWLEVYYDAKDLADGAISTTAGAITGLGGTTNNGTAYGNPQISDGAFVFDGNGDYIETTLGSHISGDWVNTVSFWIVWDVIPTSGAQTPFMIGEPNNSTNGIGVDFNADGHLYYFTTNGDVVTIYNPFDFITPGKWIHFTFIHTHSGKYVYWDGKQVGIWTSGGAPTLPTSPTLSIGRRGSSPTNYTNAKIANFRLFNRALTSDEIWQLYAYQKEYFGHGNLSMTLKGGRLGIGTSEPKATLDIAGTFKCGNSPFKFYHIRGQHLSSVANQSVPIPPDMSDEVISITGVSYNSNGDAVPFVRHNDSATWETDVYYDISAPAFVVNAQGTAALGKPFSLFVVTL